ISRLFSLEEIFNIFNALVNAQELTKRLQFQRIPLEICLVKLASDDSDKTKKNLPSEPSKAVIKHVDKKSSHDADKNERDNKHPQPLKQPSAVKKEEAEEENHGNESILSITYENIKEGWLNFINSMSKIKISVGTYLNEGEPISLKGNVLNVSFPKNYSFHKESLEGKENRILVEDCLRDVFGEKLKVNFILSQVEKSHDTVQNNPIFKTAINMFNARVVQTD
ncbi:MAG: hypothetical protein KKE64_03660, partial [Candidatus Omnitrophica bacterium]|nr:hypothetical protein [Candidatus Omnitrophota bacterium]